MNIVLWVLQVLLAVAFFAHGLLFLIPPPDIAAQMIPRIKAESDAIISLTTGGGRSHAKRSNLGRGSPRTSAASSSHAVPRREVSRSRGARAWLPTRVAWPIPGRRAGSSARRVGAGT